MPHTTTHAGRHKFVVQRVLKNHLRPGIRAVDLGSGPGATALPLHASGCETFAQDSDASGLVGRVAQCTASLNQTDCASIVGEKRFDLVAPIEVLKHAESRTGFLRCVRRLLAADDIVVFTTPTDSLPKLFVLLAKSKFRQRIVFLSAGYWLTRRSFAGILRIASEILSGKSLLGDNHVLVREAAP